VHVVRMGKIRNSNKILCCNRD